MKYVYSVRYGVQRVKTNTKKYLFSSLAVLSLIGGSFGAAFAAAPTVSSTANSNSCFGQARAYYAQGGPNGVLSPENNGYYISQRKGDNSANNAAYKAANCQTMPVTSSQTTLDACGFFVGTQTPDSSSSKTKNGVQYFSESGTFVGISNNYGKGTVTSLGNVTGTYKEAYTINNGVVSGTEHFVTNQGTVSQTFSYNTNYTNFNVNVVATGNLSFLTSDTNGECYAGTFPRP